MRPELIRLSEIEIHGEIGLIDDAWTDWRIDKHTAELITPGGWTFTPGQLLAIPLRYQYMRALEQANSFLRAKLREPQIHHIPCYPLPESTPLANEGF